MAGFTHCNTENNHPRKAYFRGIVAIKGYELEFVKKL